MSPIVSVTEIDRPPRDVFLYVTDPARFPEWQVDAVSAHITRGGPTSVGATYTTTRRVRGGVKMTTTSEIVELTDTGRQLRWTARGVGRPIRETVTYTVEPFDGNARSRFTIELEFAARSVGRLIKPLVVRQARHEMVGNVGALKERLER